MIDPAHQARVLQAQRLLQTGGADALCQHLGLRKNGDEGQRGRIVLPREPHRPPSSATTTPRGQRG